MGRHNTVTFGTVLTSDWAEKQEERARGKYKLEKAVGHMTALEQSCHGQVSALSMALAFFVITEVYEILLAFTLRSKSKPLNIYTKCYT